jgi:biopolymer transport protein ExbD
MPSPHADPHAHVIHAPGKRLLHAVPLRFVWDKATGHGRRSPSASLNLVSLIDFLMVTVLFLLSSFGASSAAPIKEIKVPVTGNGYDMIDAPLVSVSSGQILLDGVAAGSARSIAESGRLAAVPELREGLEAKRKLWMTVRPGRPFPGECLLQIDRDVPAVVVKSVFQTAVYAGYPTVSFVVRKLPAAP